MVKKQFIFWIKLLMSGILIVVLLSRVDLKLLLETVSGMRWGWLLAGYAAIWTTLLLHTWRWQSLLKGEGVVISYPNLFHHYLIGYFFGHFLPKAVGGDAIRALSLAKNGLSKTRSLTVVLVGRLVGVAVIFLSLMMCVLLSQEMLSYFPFSSKTLLGLGVFGFLSLVLGFLFLTSGLMNRIADSLFKPFRTAIDTLRTYRSKWSYLLIAFLMSVLIQLATLVRHYFAAQAVGLEIDFTTLSVVAILVMGITSVPVTINGVGLRENGFVFLLGFLGIPPEQAFTFSIMNYALMLGMAAVGGMVYMRSINKSEIPTVDELQPRLEVRS